MTRLIKAAYNLTSSPRMRVIDWMMGVSSLLWGGFQLAKSNFESGWLLVVTGLMAIGIAHFRVAERLKGAVQWAIRRFMLRAN